MKEEKIVWRRLPYAYELPEDPADLSNMCWLQAELLGRCYAPSERMKQYYAEGDMLLDCNVRWQRLKTCLKVKMAGKDDGREILAEYHRSGIEPKPVRYFQDRDHIPSNWRAYDATKT